jgi:regulator of protease activity HflC (stomatin/prohibitin superfamily)
VNLSGALRAVVGARELDVFLTDKDAVAQDIEQSVRRRAGELGLEIVSVVSAAVSNPTTPVLMCECEAAGLALRTQ